MKRRACKIAAVLFLASLFAPFIRQSSAQAKHWAFIAPMRPEVPRVKNNAWVRTPIDAFIMARLEQEGMAPSPEADRAQLLRRLSLDLIGLPPTIAELDAFLKDISPDAYEKQVERLLASPHYGERWGRWWLDVARYADTNGFEKDRDRSIWPYRDWVIEAFNQDMPFDQFTIEQLAGDLLPDATLKQRIATGFLRNSMLNEEGAVDPEQFRVEGLIDRVDAIGKSFLGLTINCAQCHTHKFDPIKHEEYYRFYAFLNSDEEPEIEVPDEKVKRKRAGILAKIAALDDDLLAKQPALRERMAEWEESLRRKPAVNWTVLRNGELIGTNGVKFETLLDDSLIARGDNPPTGVYYLKVKTDARNITGFRLELLTEHSLPRGGPGRSLEGTAWLSDFTVEAAPASAPEKMAKVPMARAEADFSAPGHGIEKAIDNDLKTSWSIDAGPGLRNQDRKAVFVPAQPVGFDGGTMLTIAISQKEFGGDAARRFEAPNIGRFRLSITSDAAPEVDPLPTRVRQLLDVPAAKRTSDEQREVFRYFRTTLPELAEANQRAAQWMKEWPTADATMVLAARPVPRETHIFKRGDWKRPGDLVTPGTPASLHPFPADAPRNRLGLAKWIVDRQNPLTARVIVNRIWQQYFGQGLVASPEDLGTRCDAPSHPALLDWLAVEFMSGGAGEEATGGQRDKETRRQGDMGLTSDSATQTPDSGRQTPDASWSLKSIHRLIVTSSVYRQSSKLTPALAQADPMNQWLARAPRYRVEAELVRDIALAASGLLSRKIGGPSVFPPIPDGALAVSFRSRSTWPTSKGEDRYRRGLYTFWKRSVPFPSMAVFDAPNGDAACPRRTRANSPLQALTTLNDAAFLEAAQALAMRVWKEGGAEDAARLEYAFRLCTSRSPDAYEQERLRAFLAQQRKNFAGQTARAVYVAAPDLENLPADLDLHEIAAWTMTARLLLNLDETISKQ